MAPYAVLVDPYRAMQTLGVEAAPLFSPDVNYIYRKQLEEAEIIVINKTDVIAPERLERLRVALGREYPDAEIMAVASRDGKGLEPLFEALSTRIGQTRRVMEVDYERYGRGEAMLGWYNGRYEVRMTKAKGQSPKGKAGAQSGHGSAARPGGPGDGFDGNAWLVDMAGRVQAVLQAAGAEVAHFKMSLVPEAESPEQNVLREARPKSGREDAAGPMAPHSALAAVSLVHSAGKPELRRMLDGPLSAGVLTVNLRAEGAPELLAITIQEALKSNPPGVKTKRLAEEAFRPGQPTPVHRVRAV